MPKRNKSINRRPMPARPKAAARSRVVKAEEFRLVDRAGRTRALLEMTRVGPRLTMMRADTTIALEVALIGDGAGVRIADEKGNTRVFVGATRGGARIGMADGDGAQRLFLGLGGAGTPGLTLYDGAQRQVWTTRAPKPQVRRLASPHDGSTR